MKDIITNISSFFHSFISLTSSPQLRPRRLSLLLPFRFNPPLCWQFCGNPLPSFGVFPVLKVAPLWVSVIHLHASLSACNGNMPSVRSSDQTAERWHSQPMLKSFQINHCMGIFMHDLLMVFTGGVSCLNLSATARHISFTIHLLREDQSFPAQRITMFPCLYVWCGTPKFKLFPNLIIRTIFCLLSISLPRLLWDRDRFLPWPAGQRRCRPPCELQMAQSLRIFRQSLLCMGKP